MPKLPTEPLFEIRHSAIHGSGAFALKRIRKGTRIIEYTGERITEEEGDRRYPDNGQPHYHTFLFALGNSMVVDAAEQGNEARFINHSCDPNCESVEDNGRIFIEAIRNIQPGAELTYDYSLVGRTPRTKAEKERHACHCGAPNCRGTMFASRKRTRSSARV